LATKRKEKDYYLNIIEFQDSGAALSTELQGPEANYESLHNFMSIFDAILTLVFFLRAIYETLPPAIRDPVAP